MRKTTPFALSFLLPALIILIALGLYPLLYSLRLSLHSLNLLSPRMGEQWVGLANYTRALRDPLFWHGAKVTALFTVGTVTSQFVVGMILALLLDKEGGKGFIGQISRTVILMPLLITPVAIGLLWRWLLDSELGVINYMLSVVGLDPIGWLTNPSIALISVIIVDIWHFVPFASLTILAGLQSLPATPYDSAKVDGANSWQVFFRITLPLLRPILVIIVLLRTINALRAFDKVYSLTSGGPGRATEVAGLLIYNVTFRSFNMGYGAALSYLLLFIVMILASVYLRFNPPDDMGVA